MARRWFWLRLGWASLNISHLLGPRSLAWGHKDREVIWKKKEKTLVGGKSSQVKFRNQKY